MKTTSGAQYNITQDSLEKSSVTFVWQSVGQLRRNGFKQEKKGYNSLKILTDRYIIHIKNVLKSNVEIDDKIYKVQFKIRYVERNQLVIHNDKQFIFKIVCYLLIHWGFFLFHQ